MQTREKLKSSQLRRYLLGQTTEEEGTAIEDRYFADDSIYEELECEELDLIDDFVAQRLAGEDLQAFRARYGRSTDGQQMVAMARGLRDDLGRTKQAGSFWRRLIEVSDTAKVAWASAACTATGLAIALFLGAHALNEALATKSEAAAEAATYERSLAETRNQLKLAEQHSASLQSELASIRTPSGFSDFALEPGARSTEMASTLRVPANSEAVRLTPRLEGEHVAYGHYRFVLLVDGRAVWKSQVDMPRIRLKNLPSIVIPAVLLSPARCSLTVAGCAGSKGCNSDESWELIQNYDFVIAR